MHSVLTLRNDNERPQVANLVSMDRKEFYVLRLFGFPFVGFSSWNWVGGDNPLQFWLTELLNATGSFRRIQLEIFTYRNFCKNV